MPAPGVVPADVSNQRELEVQSRPPRVAADQLALERGHDALGHRVVQGDAHTELEDNQISR